MILSRGILSFGSKKSLLHRGFCVDFRCPTVVCSLRWSFTAVVGSVLACQGYRSSNQAARLADAVMPEGYPRL